MTAHCATCNCADGKPPQPSYSTPAGRARAREIYEQARREAARPVRNPAAEEAS